MGAQIGPIHDPGLYEVPNTELLQLVTGIRPERASGHVFLKDAGFRSVQRLVLVDMNGGLVAGLWPGELKPDAQYLYSEGRADWFVSLASEGLWSVLPNPHIGFWLAPPHQRLYLEPTIDLEHYVELWEGSGWDQIGGHSAEELRGSLWQWLREQGLASTSDDPVLDDFLEILAGRPQAHFRAGLYLKRQWSRDEVAAWPPLHPASEVRTEINRVLGGVGEPKLPVEDSSHRPIERG